jgi:hypothetical protein
MVLERSESLLNVLYALLYFPSTLAAAKACQFSKHYSDIKLN